VTGLQAFRGFAGTSVLILVGVATDTVRRFRSDLAMQKYKVGAPCCEQAISGQWEVFWKV
jgi:preprotein translocase subunit SecY